MCIDKRLHHTTSHRFTSHLWGAYVNLPGYINVVYMETRAIFKRDYQTQKTHDRERCTKQVLNNPLRSASVFTTTWDTHIYSINRSLYNAIINSEHTGFYFHLRINMIIVYSPLFHRLYCMLVSNSRLACLKSPKWWAHYEHISLH